MSWEDDPRLRRRLAVLSRAPRLRWPLPLQALQRVGDSVLQDRGNGRPHKGLDLFAPAGTPVQAALSGRVLRVQDGRASTRQAARRAGPRGRPERRTPTCGGCMTWRTSWRCL